MNAILPKTKEGNQLKDLQPGNEVYTVPWAMYADSNGELWLNGNYDYDIRPRGIMKMKVQNTPNGYIVDISNCGDFTWNKHEQPGFVGDFTPIPVSDLIEGA